MLKEIWDPSHLLRKWWCHTHKRMRVMKATFLKRELSPPPHSQRGRDYMPLQWLWLWLWLRLLGTSCDICRCLKRYRIPSHLPRKWWCHTNFVMGVMKNTLKRELPPPPHSHRECDYMPLLWLWLWLWLWLLL